MSDYEILDILRRFENVIEFINSRKDIEEIANRVNKIYFFVTRFGSLEKLTEHLKMIEKYIYVGKEIFTVEEAAAYLGVSTSFIYRLTSGKQITVLRPSGKLLFIDREELLNWVRKFEQLSDEELENLTSRKINERDYSRKGKVKRL